MQVSIENVGKLGRKLTVRLPAQSLEDKVRTRIQEMGRSARLKGFRPGKVPTKVIEQRFGRQIRNEALSEMIGSSFQEAVSQEKLRPAVQPAISDDRHADQWRDRIHGDLRSHARDRQDRDLQASRSSSRPHRSATPTSTR